MDTFDALLIVGPDNTRHSLTTSGRLIVCTFHGFRLEHSTTHNNDVSDGLITLGIMLKFLRFFAEQ